jgi:hypothetical protein
MNLKMGISLMVEQRTLTPLVEVRVLDPQPKIYIASIKLN